MCFNQILGKKIWSRRHNTEKKPYWSTQSRQKCWEHRARPSRSGANAPPPFSTKPSWSLEFIEINRSHDLKKDLKLHPYKIQLVHALKQENYAIRLQFTEHVLQYFNDFNNILFSDKAVNKPGRKTPAGLIQSQSYSLGGNVRIWNN